MPYFNNLEDDVVANGVSSSDELKKFYHLNLIDFFLWSPLVYCMFDVSSFSSFGRGLTSPESGAETKAAGVVHQLGKLKKEMREMKIDLIKVSNLSSLSRSPGPKPNTGTPPLAAFYKGKGSLIR